MDTWADGERGKEEIVCKVGKLVRESYAARMVCPAMVSRMPRELIAILSDGEWKQDSNCHGHKRRLGQDGA